MNQQEPFFDAGDESAPSTDSAVVRIDTPGGSGTLSKSQKAFNRLIAKIEEQRQLLASWQDFVPQFQNLVSKDMLPLQKRLDEQRLALAMLFDRAHDSRGMTRRECAKLADLVRPIVDGLLTRSDEPALVALHDKYNDIGHEEARQDDAEFLKAVAASVFGVELDSELDGLRSPEDMMDAIARKMQGREAKPGGSGDPEGQGHEAPHNAPHGAGRHARPKSAKALAKETRQRERAEGVTQSVREVYRKLASALHPDRETDPAERMRKTALMQRVNQAYEKKDLLQLLELQMQAEQIDATRLAGLSESRLKHYIAVLKNQSQELESELYDVMEPFAMSAALPRSGLLKPQTVLTRFRADLAACRRDLTAIQAELAMFQDPRQLKAWLKRYRIEQVDAGDPFGDDFDRMAAMMQRPRRRR